MKCAMSHAFIFFIFLVGFISPLLADELSDYSCDGNTYEQHQCIGENIRKADKALNDTYQDLINKAKKHGGKEWVEDLRAAQRKWIEFRDVNCKFYTNFLAGGTGAGLYGGVCMVRMTIEREKELRVKRDDLAGRGY